MHQSSMTLRHPNASWGLVFLIGIFWCFKWTSPSWVIIYYLPRFTRTSRICWFLGRERRHHRWWMIDSYLDIQSHRNSTSIPSIYCLLGRLYATYHPLPEPDSFYEKKVRSIDPTFFKRLVIWGHPCELWRNQPPPPWSKPFYPPRNSRPYESGLGRPLVFFPFFSWPAFI